MSTWTNAVLTNQGASLLAKLTQGNTLTLTRAVTGTGYVDPANLAAQTTITNQRQSLLFREATYPAEGECAVPVYLTNDGVSAGYTATQVGIFANDPDNGEILFFIAQALSGSGTEIPASSSVQGFSAEWTFYFKYGQADGVTVTVNPSNTVGHTEFEQAVATLLAAIGQKADQTALNQIITALGDKLDLSGGTMTGNIKMKTANYTSIPVKVTDSGNTYGQLLQVGAGGDVIIGSGESPDNLATAEEIDGTSETMNISSDTTITLWTGCNTIANRKKVEVNASGQITVPTAPTANMHLATKQYVDNADNAKQKKITYGTAAPSGGSAGDIYIQY